MRQSIGFIINPKSGTNRLKEIQPYIETYLPKEKYLVTIHHTEFAGHATGLANSLAKENYQAVVAVGGDGTANEVAKGLIQTGTSLGLLPMGSGNGLARTCRIPLNVEMALATIAKGYIQSLDVGWVNGNIFLSNAGTGLDSNVALKCKKANQRGLLMYIRNTITSFPSYKPKSYRVEVDGKVIKKKALMISVANGNEFGYGFKIAPTAKNNDGVLDIMMIHPLNIFNAGRVSFHAWWGNLHKFSKVTHLRGRSIKISCDEMEDYQIDGDGFPLEGDLEISLQHKALNLIVP